MKTKPFTLALIEAISPYWRPTRRSLFPPPVLVLQQARSQLAQSARIWPEN